MFQLYADKNKLTVRQREQLVSGSVNAYPVRFTFSEDWDGLQRTAVFKGGGEVRSVLLDESGACSIPWETLQRPFVPLEAGVYGARGGETVRPTAWANLGTILPGAVPGEDARPPTPELWRQELTGKGDRMGYTLDGDLGLYAGDRLLSAVPVAGGGEGSAADHRLLSGRGAPDQHPVEAITGLAEVLASIPKPMGAEELRKILTRQGE